VRKAAPDARRAQEELDRLRRGLLQHLVLAATLASPAAADRLLAPFQFGLGSAGSGDGADSCCAGSGEGGEARPPPPGARPVGCLGCQGPAPLALQSPARRHRTQPPAHQARPPAKRKAPAEEEDEEEDEDGEEEEEEDGEAQEYATDRLSGQEWEEEGRASGFSRDAGVLEAAWEASQAALDDKQVCKGAGPARAVGATSVAYVDLGRVCVAGQQPAEARGAA
jgi:hypothetical protein